MGILSGNPKDEPLHYGEIFGIWEFSSKAKAALSLNQAMLQHAGDKDLKDILRDLQDMAQKAAKECDELLTANGITPPPSLPDRPEAKLEEIPPGARLSDPEIGNAAGCDIAASLVACSTMIGMAIREDVGALFAKYHTEKVAIGLRVLRLLKEKGWLVPPPLQIVRPE
ncbi:hypothetical protein J31TS4_25340 [Paenibacillus sp. J31TS4]|uniref:DUF3231 family protein n=1 Tax=Paenibacillus sp. J31TS4 TaxID=2807195 RepID=UPI001B18E2D0|nr:DUF3231 family protein [Paenibacillus sp. J31TS4]GIP39254.1 hypothetical protein J31TS4_25340 [Paenibacillus sp. J31TS4]